MKPYASLLVLALALPLAACTGSDDPASLIASAKEYMVKREYNAASIQLKSALQKMPDNGEARYLLGLSSLESGDFISAELELEKAIQLGATSDAVHIALARALVAKGDALKVIKQYAAKSLSTPQGTAEIRAQAGLAYLIRGRRDDAQKSFAEALSIDSDNTSANLGVARMVASEGDFAAALARADKALAAAPQSYEALTLKGDLLAAKGQTDPAAAAYRAAIAAAPHQPGARVGLILHLIRNRALEEASAEVQGLQKVAPRDLRTQYAKALLLAEQRKFADARQAILQVLKNAPEHVPSLTLAGMASFETGAYAEAEGHLRKAVFKAPEAVGAKRLLAATQLRMGQTDTALTAVRELLEKAGEDPAVLVLAGEAYLSAGDYAAAARHYEKAKRLKPDNVRVQTRLAQIRFAAGDTEQGLSELHATAASSGEDYQADLALITAYLRQRQPDKALEAVQGLEKKQPNNPLTHNLRGGAYLLKRDFAKARASFERSLEVSPTYMPAVTNLVRLDLRDKKPDAARKRYEAVLDKQPNNEQALLGLSVLLRLSGSSAQAIEKLLKQSIAANPTSPTARAALINHHLRTRNTKAALVAAQDASAAMPENASVLEALSVTQIAAGEHRQAVATLTRLAEMQPRSPQPHLLLARAHMAARQPEDAIRALRAALELQPELPAAQRDIAAIYVSTGRTAQALREARSAQSDQPKQPFGYVLEGEIHVAQKKWDEAERVYRQALKKFDLPILAVRSHSIMVASGKLKEAEGLADQYVKGHPKDVLMLNYLAESDLANRRYDAAAQRYRMALDRSPDSALILNNLAWVTHQLNRPNALDYAERAHELAPDNPAVMDTLGGILVASGEVERGLELLGRAAELAPTAYQIRLNLAKALLKANRKALARKELEGLAKLDGNLAVKQEATKLLKSL